MSFKMVFRSLQEVFPQVDLRILKAVAIEHSRDVDAAVEFVLSEVLPLLDKPAEASYTLDTHGMENSPAEVGVQDTFSGNQEAEEENRNLLPGSSVACESYPFTNHSCASNLSSPTIQTFGKNSNVEEDEPSFFLHQQAGEDLFWCLPSEQTSEEREITAVADHTTGDFHVKTHLFNDTVTAASSNVYVNDQLISNEQPVAVTSNAHVNKQLVSNEDFEEQVTLIDHISRSLKPLEGNSHGGMHANVQGMYETGATVNVLADCNPIRIYPLSEKIMNSLIECEEPVSGCLSRNDDIHALSDLEINNSLQATSPRDTPTSVSGDTSNMECGATLDKVDHSCLSDTKEQHSRGISDNGSESMALEIDKSSVAEKPTLVGTQSGCAVGRDILEDFISDIKSNKETLVFAFDSVNSMLKDVELYEDRAKLGKEEASKAGDEILAKAEDMREMLKHAKEAKEMQAGEVYGEKSILATEARELQSRLLILSEEKEKSLSIVEEIHRTLEARLAAAKEEETAAEKEKLEREEEAWKILKEQEVIMEEVVQESKRLQQEAEENAKLREFLMDRGHIVDILQGEMAVIFEDVMRLKERVDGYVPLSKSLLLTSRSLASSSSSSSNLRSSSERILHAVELGESTGATGDAPRNKQLERVVNVYTEINAGDSSNKPLSDDDWELFE